MALEPKEVDNKIFYPEGKIWSKNKSCFISCNHGNGWYPKIKINGKRVYVHRFMADLFIPNPLNLKYINHIDGNKLNFAISNLERVTCSQNIRHAINTGLKVPVKGQNHGGSKLKDIDISVIKEAILNGHKQNNIASYYNVFSSTISRINTGKKWRHLA